MSSFENEKIDAETANKQLSKLDLSQKDNFGDSYNTLSKISTEIEKIKVEAFQENVNIEDEKMDRLENLDKGLKIPIRKKGIKNVE